MATPSQCAHGFCTDKYVPRQVNEDYRWQRRLLQTKIRCFDDLFLFCFWLWWLLLLLLLSAFVVIMNDDPKQSTSRQQQLFFRNKQLKRILILYRFKSNKAMFEHLFVDSFFLSSFSFIFIYLFIFFIRSFLYSLFSYGTAAAALFWVRCAIHVCVCDSRRTIGYLVCTRITTNYTDLCKSSTHKMILNYDNE